MAGTRYDMIADRLRSEYSSGLALEIGAGASPYRNLFETHIGIDLPDSSYIEPDSVDVFCDARQLPFADNSFDLAFSVSAMHLIPDPEHAFSESARILKRDSLFIIFDIPLRYKRRNLKNAAGRGEYPFMSLWTTDELYKLAKQAGFKMMRPAGWSGLDKALNRFFKSYEPRSMNWITHIAQK